MTIRDMCCAGIEIEGPVRVVQWIGDECKVYFDDYAERIGDQDFLDMELAFMFSINGKLVFEIEPEDE